MAAPTSAGGARPAPREGCGVLVVDDQECVRGVLDVWLHREGFGVWLAADGREALRVYREHRQAIGVVLMDVRMPGLDGPSTLAELRKIDPGVRCCFMSGDFGGYSEAGLRELGAAVVFLKPFDSSKFSRTVSELAAAAL